MTIIRNSSGAHMDRLLMALDMNFRMGVPPEMDTKLDALAVVHAASQRLQDGGDAAFDENFDAILTLAKCMEIIQ